MRASVAVLLLAAACAAPAAQGGAAPEAAPAPARSAAVNPVGNFEFTTEVNGQPMRGSISITGSPGAYTGSVSSDMMPELPITSVAVEGQQLRVVTETPDGPVTITLNFTGDEFTGNWALGGMSGNIAGRRVR